MCESAFATHNIVLPLTKYHHCMGKLPVETVASIEDVVSNFMAFTDPYKELKKGLCQSYGRTDQQKVNKLLDLPPLGSVRPSVLMDNILSLWPDVTTKLTSKLLLGMFLRRLPEQMRAQLANYPARDPNQLAAAADAIWAQSIKSIKLSRALSFVRFIAGLRFPQDNDLADLAFLWSKLADLRYLSV